jgi:hypothetical protein
MEWVRERDLLIAQTLAFVQSVSDRSRDHKKPDSQKPEAERPEAKEPAAEPEAKPRIEAAPTDAVKIDELAGIPFNIEAVRTAKSGDFRAEIQSRVANFRAHQERFLREREEYYSATLAKVGVATGKYSTRRSPRK